ncbi:MAG TPA: hypothetical protein VHU87_13870 [Rhizomicrobium sp.]|jgi:hypothetical protein|nr:hypothetical protein [Rhizomicrobium sp.]
MAANKIDRFALLLSADVKLVEANEVLRRAGINKGSDEIAALRGSVARAMQALQGDVYAKLARASR